MWEIKCRVCGKMFTSEKPQYKQCPAACAAEYKKVYNKAYQESHKKEISSAVIRRHISNPALRKKHSRTSMLNRRGTDEEWFSVKLKEQNYCCAICETPLNEETSLKTHIDHNHKCCNVNGGHDKTCGKCLRGLLCSKCNLRLGHLEGILKESEVCSPIKGTWLEKATNYIKDYDIV
jgi:hypothetical protein